MSRVYRFRWDREPLPLVFARVVRIAFCAPKTAEVHREVPVALAVAAVMAERSGTGYKGAGGNWNF